MVLLMDGNINSWEETCNFIDRARIPLSLLKDLKKA
jgi:hypothetical protein